MKSLFFNSTEKRLRAGWRISVFLILFFSLTSLIFVVRPIIGDITRREFLENYSLIIVAILAFSATVSSLLSRKFLDKKTFISLGLRFDQQALKDLLFGFLLSFIMAATFFLLLLSLGFIEFNGFNFQKITFDNSSDFIQIMSAVTLVSLGLMLLEHILVGYWEELVFRGYLFQNMTDGLGLVISIVISCLIYGLIHYSNPNATLLSSVIIIAFGFLRIYGYLCTKMLWLSMGMHIGWNFFQGPVFGFAASGHKKPTLLLHTIISDKEYLTGGEFGPEGSILTIPILILTLGIMRRYSNKFYGISQNTIDNHI